LISAVASPAVLAGNPTNSTGLGAKTEGAEEGSALGRLEPLGVELGSKLGTANADHADKSKRPSFKTVEFMLRCVEKKKRGLG
jgi:hypothetical protein